jgi:hypothetical protein
MSEQSEPHPALHSAIAGVEACDTRYKAGVAETVRRRTLVLRVKPLGLWLILGLALAPGVWTLLAELARTGLKWVLAILG